MTNHTSEPRQSTHKPVAFAQYNTVSGDKELEWYRHGAGHLTESDKEAGWTEVPLYARPEPRQPDELSDSLTHRAVVEGVDLTVSISDAVKFLEVACRNWANVDVDQDDVADVASALKAFLQRRVTATHPTSQPLPDAVEQSDYDLAEQVVSAANIVTNGGCYEIDIDAVAKTIARHRLSAMPASSGEVAQVVAWLREQASGDLMLPAYAEFLNAYAHAIERGEHRGTPSDHGWRDIASAPKDGTWIDLWYPSASGEREDGWRRSDCYWDGGWCKEIDYPVSYQYLTEARPTHWQPIPTPPHRGTDGSAEG